MKQIYTATILIFVMIMLIVGQRAKRKNSRLAASLIRLTYAVSITVLASVLAIMITSEPIALFLQTLHYASTEWVLIFLLVFFEEYVDGFEGVPIVRIMVYLYSGVSSVMLFSNVLYGQIVKAEYRVVDEVAYRIFRTGSVWYNLHKYFSYGIAFLALLVLISATVKATAFYRKKYWPAVVALLITMALEGLCTARDTLMDYALFGYIGLAIFLIYYSVYHVNNGLITRTLSYVTNKSSGGVICFDRSGKCIYANEMIFTLYNKVSDLSEFEDIFSQYKSGETKEKTKWRETFVIDKEKQYYEISFDRLEDHKKEYIGCFLSFYDKTEDVLSLEEARFQASHDLLTGIYNDYGFGKTVEKLCKTFPDEEFYIVTADIKDFKLINDLYGYEMGDVVLKTMAKSMKDTLPAYAPCCRKTSDHFFFCIKKQDFSEERALQWSHTVESVLNKLDYHFMIHYGIYQIQAGEDDVNVMCDYARMAMHRIKNSYERYFEYFDMSMMEEVLMVKDMVRSFDEALENGEFKMFLQPQVTTDGVVMGAEALSRWDHPYLGMVNPGVFIPVFEDVGLVYKLDQFIWESAAKQLHQWKGTHREQYHISVNISAKDFLYVDVYNVFVSLVEKYEIEPKRLKLEITESAFMNEPEKQLKLIEKLQSYGFIVEIDDFGSGYSSLNILKDMKANVLKIDMGFLKKTKEVERSQTILNTIIMMAKELRMEVVTEGVEEEEQIEFLTKAGCDLLQGFYFDKPISISSFEQKY